MKLSVAWASVMVLIMACNSPTQHATPTVTTPNGPLGPAVLNIASPSEPTGVIIGVVGTCSALPIPGGAPHQPAVVTVRKGTAVWQPIQNGWMLVLPNETLANAGLKARQPYRFIVSAGEYVLTTHELGEPSGLNAWTNVTVHAGETVQANLNPTCK